MSKIIHYTDNRHYQVMLTIIVAYGIFYLAEALGVSGVLATVAAGILLAYEFGKNIKDGKIQGSLDGFWNIINPALLGLLFLLIGIQGAEYLAFSKWGLAVGIFFLSILARFLVLAGFIYGVPAWRKEFTNDFSTTSLITWSGIKGAMSVALLLWFENEAAEKDELLVSLAFAVILLSLVIQSVGVYPLTKLIKKQDK
jgi:CPA1 family monovalent cation:H+ antiporter